ncbi:MAG: hypothetical protein ACKVIH_04075 [Burkholderiales bacterium]
MSTSVKYFTSGMGGAPVLSNNWGDMIGLLDACLVTGFAARVVASLTSAAGIATATISAGHTYLVDQIIEVAGCNEAAYNGQFRVLSATTNQFTYAIAGSPASPATTATSISARVAALGFEKVFTGTNKAVYRSLNMASNRPYLRVDNSLDPNYNTTYAKFAKVTMAEAMTDIDTFVQGAGRAPFDPTNPSFNEGSSGSGASAVVGWHKWYHARGGNSDTAGDGGSGARTWVLIGDDRGFYLGTNFNLSGTYFSRTVYSFTDFESYKTADSYNTILTATDFRAGANSTLFNVADFNSNFTYSNEPIGKLLMRNYTQLGNPIRAGFFALQTHNAQNVSGRIDSITFPNGPNFSLLLHPTYIREELGAHIRGVMPGLMWVHHSGSPYSDLTVVDNVAGWPGRKFLIVAVSYSSEGNTARIAFDITGPWR